MTDKNTIDIPLCECEEIHGTAVAKRRAEMPEVQTIYRLSDFFKILGDSTRASILFCIHKEPMCVCDIAAVLDMTKSAVSHQLNILRRADLVRYTKQGKNVFYMLSDQHVIDIIDEALDHINE